jgi:hypothetical protein
VISDIEDIVSESDLISIVTQDSGVSVDNLREDGWIERYAPLYADAVAPTRYQSARRKRMDSESGSKMTFDAIYPSPLWDALKKEIRDLRERRQVLALEKAAADGQRHSKDWGYWRHFGGDGFQVWHDRRHYNASRLDGPPRGSASRTRDVLRGILKIAVERAIRSPFPLRATSRSSLVSLRRDLRHSPARQRELRKRDQRARRTLCLA